MKYFIILILVLTTHTSFTQTRKFSINWGSDSIGYLTAQSAKTETSETIKINTNSKFSVLFIPQHMVTSSTSFFKKDTLNNNKSESQLNNDDKELATTSVCKGDYLCIKDGKKSTLKEKIKFTVSKLYFYEPKNINSIYSERHLAFCKITLHKKGVYKLTLPNGNVNYYTYKNGKLEKMTSKRMGFTLTFSAV